MSITQRGQIFFLVELALASATYGVDLKRMGREGGRVWPLWKHVHYFNQLQPSWELDSQNMLCFTHKSLLHKVVIYRSIGPPKIFVEFMGILHVYIVIVTRKGWPRYYSWHSIIIARLKGSYPKFCFAHILWMSTCVCE
jgi:hypothetical protein